VSSVKQDWEGHLSDKIGRLRVGVTEAESLHTFEYTCRHGGMKKRRGSHSNRQTIHPESTDNRPRIPPESTLNRPRFQPEPVGDLCGSPPGDPPQVIPLGETPGRSLKVTPREIPIGGPPRGSPPRRSQGDPPGVSPQRDPWMDSHTKSAILHSECALCAI
jgi:hypothetical protein